MSKRTQIIDALVGKLQTITTANGYNTDAGNSVYKSFVTYTDIREFPALTLLIGDANYAPLTNQKYTSGAAAESADGWAISVVGYTKVASNVGHAGVMTDAIEELVEDIIKAVLNVYNLGLSFVHNVYLTAVLPYEDWEAGVGVAQIVFQVKYDFEKASP